MLTVLNTKFFSDFEIVLCVQSSVEAVSIMVQQVNHANCGRMCIFNSILIVITFCNVLAVCCAMLFSNVGNYLLLYVTKKLGVLP